MFDPVQVTRELIAFNSISANSNAAVSDYLQEQLGRAGFTVERITYQDAGAVEKAGWRCWAIPTPFRWTAGNRIPSRRRSGTTGYTAAEVAT